MVPLDDNGTSSMMTVALVGVLAATPATATPTAIPTATYVALQIFKIFTLTAVPTNKATNTPTARPMGLPTVLPMAAPAKLLNHFLANDLDGTAILGSDGIATGERSNQIHS